MDRYIHSRDNNGCHFTHGGGGTGSAQCPSGFFSISGAAACTVCPQGTYSGIGAATCTACPVGSTTPGAGAAGSTPGSCNVCAPGYYSLTGFTNAVGGCNAVAAGYYPSKEVVTYSLDSGTYKTWTGIAVSEDLSKIASCRRHDYIYLSVDSGSSWTPLMNAQIQDWLGITGNPTLTKLAATCSGCNIKLSLDGGSTWTDLKATGKTSWIGIVATPDFNSMIASQYGDDKYIYRTDDGGASWSAVTGAPTGNWALMTASADLTYIAVTAPQLYDVFISTTSGKSFNQYKVCTTEDLWDLAASYDFNKIVATCAELYISTDKGKTWSQLGTPPSNVVWIGIAGNFDLSRMVATSGPTYIYQSDNAGANWQGLFGDIIGAPAPDGYATQETQCPPGMYSDAYQSSCTLCPQGTFSMPGNTTYCTPCATGYTTPGTGMIATSQSICSVCAPGYLSYNGLASDVGTGCKISEAGKYPVRSTNIRSFPGTGYYGASASFDFSYIIVASQQHLLLSANSGASWDRLNNVPAVTGGWKDVFVSGNFQNIIAASEYLVVSYDSGTTWETLTAAGRREWYGVAATPDLQTIVATTGGSQTGQVFLSTDGGAVFGPLGGAGTSAFRGVTANQELTKIIAVDSENNEVCISLNSGATWTKSYIAPLCYGITSSFNFQKVAVACGDQIYLSVDSGAFWSPRPQSLRPQSTVWAGLVGNFDLSKMFIASSMTNPNISSILMQSDDSGDTWVQNGLISGVEARTGYGSSAYACVEGSYATAGSYMCTACPKGTYSAAGASVCTSCPVGLTTPGVGIAGTSSSVCNECALGLYSQSGLATDTGAGCTSVPAGSFPTATINVESFVKVPAPELQALYNVAVSNDFMNIAICEASGYIQLSRDSGQTWTPMIGAGKHFWTAVKGSPQFEQIVATHFNGMVISLDGGATWSEKSNNPMSDLNGIYKSLAITNDLTSMLVICHSEDGTTKNIYRTDNTAGTWYQILPNLGASPAFLIASHDLTMIYINTYTSIYKVTYGTSVTATKLAVQLGDGSFGGLAASYDFNTVITSYQGGIAISKNGGDTFTRLPRAPTGSFNGLAGNADLSKMVALDYNSDDVTKNLYQSADSGETWILNGAIPEAVAINGKATGTSPCPGGTYAPNSGGGRCLVCPAGKFSPSSGGATACTSCPTGHTTHGPGAVGTDQATVCTDCAPGWFGTGTGTCTLVPAGSFPSNPMSITPLVGNTGTTQTWTSAAVNADNSKMIAVQQLQYIYLTTNSGANWVPLTSAGRGDYRGVCVSQDFSKIAVAEYQNFIKVSYNSGATWVQLPRDRLSSQTGIKKWLDIRSNPAFTVMVALVENDYIYRSIDGGNSWLALTSSQTSSASNSASMRSYVKLASSEDMTRLIATVPSERMVGISNNGGDDWSAVVIPFSIGAISCTYDFSILIAAGTSNTEIYTSTDGYTWRTLSASLDVNSLIDLSVLSFGVSPDLQFVAMTTTTGVYFSNTYPNYRFSKNLEITNGIFPTGGATTKALCGLGQFSEAGATRCTECPAATYSDTYGSASCTECATGYTNQGPGYIESACIICSSGFIGQTTGTNSVCTSVPSGFYPVRTVPMLSSQEQWGGIAASSDFATIVAAGEHYLQISSDSGVTWFDLATAGRRQWGGLYGSPNMQNLLATVKAVDYVYMSTDSGLSWKNLPGAGTSTFSGVTATPDLSIIVVVSQYPDNCTGTDCAGYVKISTDYGVNFKVSNKANSNNWVAITSNEDLSKIIVAAKGSYLYQTDNLGATWEAILVAEQHSWTALAASSELKYIIAFNDDTYQASTFGGNRRLVSTNGGASFSPTGSATLGQNIFTGVVVSPDFIKQAIVGVGDGTTTTGFYVTYSGDSGKTWSWTTNPQAIAPSGGGMISAECVPGTYSTGGAALCTYCPVGKYSQGGATSCTACLEGYTTAGIGFQGSDNSVCSVCAKGYTSKGTTNGGISCVALYAPSATPTQLPTTLAPTQAPTYGLADCVAGTYYTPGKTDTPIPNCSYCPAGKYSATHGASECTSCEAGKFSDIVGLSSSCQLCQPGTFSTGNAATACSSCLAGHYSSVGASSCSECSFGNYNPNSGSTQCSPCVSGTFASKAGVTACEVCPVGKFSGPGASTCTDCQAGYSAPLGQPCSPCPPNTYSTGGGKAYCSPCEAGSTSNAGASQCIPCSPGFFALQGQTCMLCPAGRYSDNAGSSYCSECPEGDYSTDGSTSCKTCTP